MPVNTIKTLRQLLIIYAVADELVLDWDPGVQMVQLVRGQPAELKVYSLDGTQLASVFAFEDGFSTVLAALDTTAEQFKRLWSHQYPPCRLRVRWDDQKFTILNVR